MVKIIVDTVIYTCLVLVFVGFAVFAMLFLRTAISDAKAASLCDTCSGSVQARLSSNARG
jgi:hypothetical protein